VGKDKVGPWNNLSAVVRRLRADLPRNATLYYNEAATVIAQRGAYYYYPHVPVGLDWISLDMYSNEGTAFGVRSIYTQHLYPIMSARQRFCWCRQRMDFPAWAMAVRAILRRAPIRSVVAITRHMVPIPRALVIAHSGASSGRTFSTTGQGEIQQLDLLAHYETH
jgi:hypothetical protein